MIYDHRFRVRYAETDAMRAAHHAAYPVWCEAARVEALRALGFSFAEVEGAGYGQAIRELRVQYRQPVRFAQALVLRVALVQAGGPRVTFGYRLHDAGEYDAVGEDATVLALALTELVWVTPDGRPTRLPASHQLASVLAAQERHLARGEW